MKTTLVTEKNARMFLQVLPDEVLEASNLFLGAIDEETDTACGVLSAMIDVDGNILITYVFVAEEFRNRGAGKALIDTLIEFARAGDAHEITCIHERRPESSGVYELLDSSGFTLFDPACAETYEARLSDFSLPAKKVVSNIVPLKKLSDHQWMSYSERIGILDREDENGTVLSLSKRNFYDPAHSFVYLAEDGKVQGALLVDTDEGDINLDELRVFGDDTGIVMLDLIITAVRRAGSDFGGDRLVVMNPYSAELRAIMNKLSKGKARKRSDTVVQLLAV